MRKATDQRDAQTISLLWTSLLLFHGGDVTCFDACHVIWCGGHVIWCDVIACVVSCHVMQCDVMWCALQWSRCVFEVVLWQCGDPKYDSVLQSTTPVLLCTTKYYSSTTLYYTVLQRTTPVLPCTTKYYYVLQSTTPVLLCTTKYYSSTTLHYTALQRTTPVLLCTKVLLQYYSDSVLQSSIHDWSLTHMNRYLRDWCPSHMKRHLQCAEQQESSSNFTKYCTCHAKWLWWLIRVTYETSFRMRGATRVTLHLHQILRLPRKMNLMIDPRHIWNVI